MDSKIFDRDIPDEILGIIIEKAGGERFRVPNSVSKYNPLYRKRRDKQICQKYNQGATLTEISQAFNLSDRRISQILSDNGIKVQKMRSVSRIERISLALKIGMGKTQIAKKEGISRTRIYQIIRKEGLE